MDVIDEREIYRWFNVFKGGNQLTEIRIISNDNKIGSGYFTDAQTMINAVRPYANDYSVYFTINRINSDCYGRPQRDRIVLRPKNTTTDNEIIGRDWILIDLDSKRAAGVSATQEQLNEAKKKANDVYRFLKDNGFYEPIVICSGSGVHLYIRCALKVNEENDLLVKRFLSAMGMLFSNENVEVDQKVFNPARISRVVGYYNRKGSKNDPLRPQRVCSFVKIPKEVKVNEKEYFEKIANIYPEETIVPNRYNNYSTERFDLDAFIKKHNIQVTKVENITGGKKYILDHCLFNDQHKGKDAVIFQRDNGAIAYFCYHSSCANNDWRKVRLMFEPDAYDKKEYRGYKYDQNRYKKKFEPIQETIGKGEVWLKMSQIKKPKFDLNDYIPSGIKQIDDLIIGFKRKHVTVWSGYRGCAKTTFLNMLVLNGANLGYKSALWTGELDADEEKQWLYLQASGKGYNKEVRHGFYATPDNICDKIDVWIDKYFWIFNNEYKNNFKQIVDKIRELKQKEDIDFVILDNLMVLDIDDLEGDKNDRQKNLMYILTCLAKELNIHIHIVAHPNKSGTFLRPNNISGTGHIPDLAQNVFILHRIGRDFHTNAQDFLSSATLREIEDSSCTNCMEICKCRAKGSAVDHFIKLYFEKESNRLKNSVAEHVIYGWQEEPTQATITCANNGVDNEIDDMASELSGDGNDAPF